jgi:hypothetical protein
MTLNMCRSYLPLLCRYLFTFSLFSYLVPESRRVGCLRFAFSQSFQFTTTSPMEQSSGADSPKSPERPIVPEQDGNGSDEKPRKSWRFWVRSEAGKPLSSL